MKLPIEPDHQTALGWIVTALESATIPYLICGGLAARLYGASRPLVDLDFFVPLEHFDRAAGLDAEHLVESAHFHEGSQWQLYFCAYEFQSVRIEIADAERSLIREGPGQPWQSIDLDFQKYSTFELTGLSLRAMDRLALIAYKQLLNRGVDRQDLREIENSPL